MSTWGVSVAMYQYFEINKSGHSISCKLYFNEIDDVRRVIIFCHGFGGHKDNNAAMKLAKQVLSRQKDCAVITFNWPAHGDDPKKELHLEDGSSYLDLLLSYVVQSFHTENIYACATSFGGYLILKYIFEHGNPFRKIALRCPAVNMHDVLTRAIMSYDQLSQVRKGHYVSVGFDRKVTVGLSLLEELKTKDIQHWDYQKYADDILIIHGTADEIVPFNVSFDFAKNNLIEFIAVDDADHRFVDENKMELAIRQILDFFDSDLK